MKRYILKSFGILAIALGFIACSDTDKVDNTLSEYPKFTGILTPMQEASQTRAVDVSKKNLKISSRDSLVKMEASWFTRRPLAAEENNWENMVNRHMSVMIGTTVYDKYHIDKDGNILASVGPFIFNGGTYSGTSTVAWYPGTERRNLDSFAVQTNQEYYSQIEKSDLLYGTQTSATQLNFKHKMAQIRMNIKVNRFYKRNGTGAEEPIYPSKLEHVWIANTKVKSDITLSGSPLAPTITPRAGSLDTILCFHDSLYDIKSSDTTYCYRGMIIPQNADITLIFQVSGKLYYGEIENYTYQGGYLYTVNVSITDEVHFQIGDYLYCRASDSAFVCDNLDRVNEYLADGYRPIGLIFSTTPCREDQLHGWTNGYAMSLTCGDGRIMYHTWGNYQVTQYGSDWETAIKYYNGYDETHHVTDNASFSSGTHPAYFYARDYASRFSPTTGPQQFYYPTIGGVGHTSGWYLPSIGQWWLILTNLGKPDHTNMTYDGGRAFYWNGQRNTVRNNINAYMTAVDPYTDVTYITNQTCQASNECNSDYGISVIFHDNGHMYPYHWGGRKPYEGYSVWPVIAF